MPTWVGLIRCELFLPGAQSLKDKRRTVRSLVERMHRRYRVSVAETGLHDLHQRAEISVAAVTGNRTQLEHLLDGLRRSADELQEAVVASWESDVLETADGQ